MNHGKERPSEDLEKSFWDTPPLLIDSVYPRAKEIMKYYNEAFLYDLLDYLKF